MTSDNNSNLVPNLKLVPTARTIKLQQFFIDKFKKNPDLFVRVPGRVNLIGEHIDYCGYGVCPMALEQDIVLAISVEDEPILELHNYEEEKFAAFRCDLNNFEISVGEGAPQWHQYFLCGVRGILDMLPESRKVVKGMKIVVSGSIPQSAGLSSSSALVSAAALAASHTYQLQLSKERIANLCAESERFIGTIGGGMDQAIAFLATKGCAKLIEFSPLRSKDVHLPSDAVFVIAHSLTNLNKAATADFNCRVVECRLAAQLLAKKTGHDWSQIHRLGELQQTFAVDLPEMISIVNQKLHEEPYTKREVIADLATTSDRLDETSLTPNTSHIQMFKLKQRALHVFHEALRVEQFYTVCRKPDSSDKLAQLGKLMHESHVSLRDLYECSNAQLDQLVAVSKDHTLGTRLTGAGWGGCVVSLLQPDNVNNYVNFLKEVFYKPLGALEQFDDVVFVTSPNLGASFFTLV